MLRHTGHTVYRDIFDKHRQIAQDLIVSTKDEYFQFPTIEFKVDAKLTIIYAKDMAEKKVWHIATRCC